MLVEEGVEISPQQQAIGNLMPAVLRYRNNVCRLERRQSPFASDYAAMFVCLNHADAKGALSQPWTYERRCPEHGRGFSEAEVSRPLRPA